MYIIHTQIHKFKIKTHRVYQSVANIIFCVSYIITFQANGHCVCVLCVYVWLKRPKINFLIVPKSRSQYVGISVIPLEAPGEIPFLVLSSFWQPLAFLGLWICHSNLYLCLDMAFSMCLCVSIIIWILVIGFRALLKHQEIFKFNYKFCKLSFLQLISHSNFRGLKCRHVFLRAIIPSTTSVFVIL